MSNELIVTTGNKWRESLYEIVRLPSGNVAKLKRVSLLGLAAQGQLPDFFTGIVVSSMNGSNQGIANPKAIPEMNKAMTVICKECFVSPQIVDDNPNDTQITMHDLTDMDKAFVVKWASGGKAEALRTFPTGQNPGVGAVSHVPAVRPASVPPTADKG